jgi:hypothetical protein
VNLRSELIETLVQYPSVDILREYREECEEVVSLGLPLRQPPWGQGPVEYDWLAGPSAGLRAGELTAV